jgi:hypothetical protein
VEWLERLLVTDAPQLLAGAVFLYAGSLLLRAAPQAAQVLALVRSGRAAGHKGAQAALCPPTLQAEHSGRLAALEARLEEGKARMDRQGDTLTEHGRKLEALATADAKLEVLLDGMHAVLDSLDAGPQFRKIRNGGGEVKSIEGRVAALERLGQGQG